MDRTRPVEITIVLYLLNSSVWLRKMSRVLEQVTGEGERLFGNFLSYIHLLVFDPASSWPSAVLPSPVCTQCHLGDGGDGALPGSGVGEPTNRCGLLQAEVQIPGGDG